MNYLHYSPLHDEFADELVYQPKLADLGKPQLFGEFVQYMIKENETNETTPEERNRAAMEMFKKEDLDYLEIVGEIVRQIQAEEEAES